MKVEARHARSMRWIGRYCISSLALGSALTMSARAEEGGQQSGATLSTLAPVTSLAAPAMDVPASSVALAAASFDLADLSREQDTAASASPIAGPSIAPEEMNKQEGSVRSDRYRSLGSRIGAAKWETLGLFAYITATQAYWTDDTTSFHFKNEGWFGRDTNNLGIDKLTHAFNAYLFAEFLGARIARKTGDRAAAALPAAILSTGLQFYGELWDGHKTDSGFSYQDIVFNTAGAAFSVLRHTVPGLEEKLDFRLMVKPNSEVYSFKGKRHYEQQHFLLSLEMAGFKQFKSSPLRFVELQVGYRGRDFLAADRAAGIKPKRDIFFGVALNLKELFFRDSRSRLGRAIGSGLNYFQIPYTGVYDYY